MVGALRLPVPVARAMIDYDRTVFGRFERKVRRLPSSAAFAEREIGHHSLFGTLVHILNVHDAWLNYIVPGRGAEFGKVHAEGWRHPTDWKGFAAYRTKVWAGVGRFRDGLTDRALARPVRAPWMPGRYTVADVVFQTSLEEAHHLGEIIGALWQEDRPSPAMTWIQVQHGPAR